MKKKITYLLLTISAFMLVSGGCGEKDKKPETYNVDQYVKEWMFFDTGTYWIYQEMNSGLTDSQYVTKSGYGYFETYPKNKKSPNYREQSALVYTNKDYFFYLTSSKENSLIQKRLESSTESGITYLLFKQLFIGGFPPGSFTKITAIDKDFQLDNLKDTMITLLDARDESENNDSVEYKVFKGVGIIGKNNLTKNEDWRLIRYHINLNKQ